MSHNLGRVVPDGRTFDETNGLDLVPSPGPLGGPRFVILHFDSVNLTGGATLTVNLGYATDVFAAGSGTSFWSRPVDGSISPIAIRITGGTGSARLREYGSGEPSTTPGGAPGTSLGSQSNPDPFLHTNPYAEPLYETRLECHPGFAWQNAACPLASISTPVRERVAAATGIIVEVHGNHVSSCSGTLIGPDLFLTARHCLTDPAGEDVRSASVTFDYATQCDGTRPPGHVTRFFKVIGEVRSGSPPTGSDPPASTDWVIVRLDAAPGALPPPLPMRDTVLMLNERIFTMHHPNGAVKKTQEGLYAGGTSITGFDYAGGSSGSALFDGNGRVVAGPLSRGPISNACTVIYAPLAPIRAALSTPPPPPVPLDVMLVFDRSGSMASSAPPIGRTKLQEAQDAAALFVQLLREGQGDRVGLVTFSSGTTTNTPPGPVAAVKTTLVGPAPFTSGQIGAITTGGSTSIGGGLEAALTALGSGSTNGRAILLMTDGLQNTPPMVESVEGSLGTTKLCVIGFGSDADIDGRLLSRVAHDHGGDFTRAIDGLALRKFFGLCFGNIFETGALGDPDFVLAANQKESATHEFSVCGEERITVILGWDEPSTPLTARIYTPSGQLVNEKRTETARGRTWVFWRVALPYAGERDGAWKFVVERVEPRGEFFAAPTDVRYFFLIVSSGGPKLRYLGGRRRVYTGDPIDALVGLHYPNGTSPHAEVELTIERPTVALGELVTRAGLRPPSTTSDPVDAFRATLQAIAQQAGGTLPVPTATVRVPLFDDGSHDDGAMEPDGVYNDRLKDVTRVEGTYQFRAVATYGEGCRATREAFWSVHVEPGIDASHSGVSVTNVTTDASGSHGTVVIVPRDCYDNPLGPGRGDSFTVDPMPGVTTTGAVTDRGDGSYGVDVSWNPAVTPTPGVILGQPGRSPVPMIPPGAGAPCDTGRNCNDAAENLLECLGIERPAVKHVRVKSVTLKVRLKHGKDCDDPDCED
jgi:hypothetical protein